MAAAEIWNMALRISAPTKICLIHIHNDADARRRVVSNLKGLNLHDALMCIRLLRGQRLGDGRHISSTSKANQYHIKERKDWD
jgi:hypothetical protein